MKHLPIKQVEFFWEGTPPRSTAQTRRHTKTGKTYRTPENAKAIATLRAIAEPHAPVEPFLGPLRVTVSFTWKGKKVAPKTTRPDVDNLAKDFLDALGKAGYYFDDNQVVDLRVLKYVGPVTGIFCRVEEVSP